MKWIPADFIHRAENWGCSKFNNKISPKMNSHPTSHKTETAELTLISTLTFFSWERKILFNFDFNSVSDPIKEDFSYHQHSPGGSDCFSFSAFSLSVMTRVYRYLLQRTLNFTLSLFFLILTAVGQQGHGGALRNALKFIAISENWSNLSLANMTVWAGKWWHSHLASFLLAVSRKSLISSILRGCSDKNRKMSVPRKEKWC